MNQSFGGFLRRKFLAALGAFLVGSGASAVSSASEAAREERTGYSLWSPVPATDLRELSTDRPDQTESPFTVDAGHFQLEMDVVTFTYDRDFTSGSEVRTKAWSVAPVNLKAGLTPRLDVQLMLDTYATARVEDRASGAVARASGFGDITTRLKFNFWGNDGGKTAFAVMPFVKWPLSASGLRNGETEGGIIFPLAMELPDGWGMGAMTEIDFVSDGASGHDTEWLNSITFGRDLTERLGGYVELVVVTGDAPGFRWKGQFDIGFTYALADATRIDFGCNFGITRSAPDYQPFLGFSRRF